MISKKNTKNKEVKRIVFEIPAEKHREIKMTAASLNTTIKDFIDTSLELRIKNERKKLNEQDNG